MRLIFRLSDYIEHGLAAERPEHRLRTPGVTAALIVILWLITHFFPQVTPSLAIPFLGFLVATFWWGSLFSSLLGAFVISAYVIIEPDLDPWRSGQLIAASVVGAFLTIAVRESLIRQIREAERARRVENLVNAADKTLVDLKDEYLKVAEAVGGWSMMDDQSRFEFIVAHRGKLANIAQAGLGYHQLWLERQEILKGETDV